MPRCCLLLIRLAARARLHSMQATPTHSTAGASLTPFPFQSFIDRYRAQTQPGWLCALVNCHLDAAQVAALRAIIPDEHLLLRYPLASEDIEPLAARWVILGQNGSLDEPRLHALHAYLVARHATAPYRFVSLVHTMKRPDFMLTQAHSCSLYSVEGEAAGIPLAIEWPSELRAFFSVLTPEQQAGWMDGLAFWACVDERHQAVELRAPESVSPLRAPYTLTTEQYRAFERLRLPEGILCQLLSRFPEQVSPDMKLAQLLKAADAVVEQHGQDALPALLVQHLAASLRER